MVKACIFGATGYAGAVLTAIIARHKRVKLSALLTSSQEGELIENIYPTMKKDISVRLEGYDDYKAIEESDIVFTALPHGKSFSIVDKAIKLGKRVIDLSGDHRFKNALIYNKWYETEHINPNLLNAAVYGLPELYYEEIKNAKLLSNPGCYPTSAILGLAPLMKRKTIDISSIIIDAKSGVSGAGRSISFDSSFVQANENTKAYKISKHRHTPEIEEQLSYQCGSDVYVSFTPHLVPMSRGILSTIYVNAIDMIDINSLIEYYKDFYESASFVRVLDYGLLPQTRWVAGTNYCDIGIEYDIRTRRIIIVSAIDNLIKGAAGQAVQNMNIMMGFDQKEGLELNGIIP